MKVKGVIGMVVIFLFSIFLSRSGWAFLKAGTAKGIITPPDIDQKQRISVMGYPLKGVKHDIYARVLVLDDGKSRLVIVSYDLNCLDVATPILRARCKKELGIDPAYLILLATHNHAAPIQIVPDNFDYGRWLAQRIFELIKEAISREKGPVQVFFGSRKVDMVAGTNKHGYVYAVLFGDEPIDKDVQLLKVTYQGKVLALLFNQATHPLHETFHKIGVCHCGYAIEELEQRFPGALAMYADACGGNQFLKRGFAVWAPLWKVKKVGKELADIVTDIAQGEMIEISGEIFSKRKIISLPLAQPISYDEAEKLARKIPTDIGFVSYPHPQRKNNWIRALLKYYELGVPFPTRTTDMVCTDDGFLLRIPTTPEERKKEISAKMEKLNKELFSRYPEEKEYPCIYEEAIVARIGRLIFVAMQGEVCAPICVRIKQAFKDKPVMVFAYMGEHNLYIPTRYLVKRNAYQAQVIQIQYASPVPWSEEVEDVMTEEMINLIKSVLKVHTLHQRS